MANEVRVVDLEPCTVTFLGGDIVHTHFKKGQVVRSSDVQAMFDVVDAEMHGHKALLMVSAGEGASMTNDARALASASSADRYFAADAIVLRDFGHQLAANVFVRHHRPARPIEMFPDTESALAWLSQQRHLIDQP